MFFEKKNTWPRYISWLLLHYAHPYKQNTILEILHVSKMFPLCSQNGWKLFISSRKQYLFPQQMFRVGVR